MAKRKQRGASSSAMSSTFTRSRSEIFLHRTRSGRARPDPKRRPPAPAPPLSDGPHNSVKDLRLKRVFSDHEGKIETDGDDHQADEKRGGSDDFEIAKGSSDDAYSMQTTTKNPDKASESDGVRVSEESNSGNSPENKPRLWPCSRLKLIGNPSSFSYRRLLPYLKDLAKDGSSGIGILQSHNCGLLEVEKPMKESWCLLNSSSEQQNHDVPLGDSTMVNSNGDHDFKENPVLEATHPDSHQEIVDKVMKVESPSTCIGSKLPIPGVTSEVGFNDKNADELNRQEQKATNKERIGNDVEVLKESDDCSVDMVQSTPPDAELDTKFDGAELGSRRTISEPGFSSMSKNSSGLVLCSRSKLYRNPSSFSYRRLLPYLMDLAKISSSGMDTIHSQNCTTNVETSLQEKPSMLETTPSPTQHHQTLPPVDSSSVHSGENQDSEVNHGSESSGLDSQGDIRNPVTTELPNSCNMSKGQVVGCTTEIPLEKSNFEFEMLSKSSFCTPIISEALSVEELAGVMPELSYSPMQTDRTPKQNVSHFKGFGHGAKQALAPRKSILKKQSQSRGCKGFCMCLECTTFHVHAERAYEFSRRQMADADEVVERLMKELSHMRNLMEGSVASMVDGAESYTVLQVNQEQVKGVCQRAFRVEEHTKSRMRQMFCDLNIHCRIPGPRVSFSDHVDERNIS